MMAVIADGITFSGNRNGIRKLHFFKKLKYRFPQISYFIAYIFVIKEPFFSFFNSWHFNTIRNTSRRYSVKAPQLNSIRTIHNVMTSINTTGNVMMKYVSSIFIYISIRKKKPKQTEARIDTGGAHSGIITALGVKHHQKSALLVCQCHHPLRRWSFFSDRRGPLGSSPSLFCGPASWWRWCASCWVSVSSTRPQVQQLPLDTQTERGGYQELLSFLSTTDVALDKFL